MLLSPALPGLRAKDQRVERVQLAGVVADLMRHGQMAQCSLKTPRVIEQWVTGAHARKKWRQRSLKLQWLF
jgi:hypothetical protein